MKALREYIIHFGNLKPGKHAYDFQVDERFFSAFEYSLVKKGEVKADLILDKQSENFFTIFFEMEGYLVLECDRCLDEFQFPVALKERILVKLDGKETESSDELIFLKPEAYEIDVSPFIYEFLNLALPLRRVCETVGKECNPAMLAYLQQKDSETAADDEPVDPRWAALKKLNQKGDEKEEK